MTDKSSIEALLESIVRENPGMSRAYYINALAEAARRDHALRDAVINEWFDANFATALRDAELLPNANAELSDLIASCVVGTAQ